MSTVAGDARGFADGHDMDARFSLPSGVCADGKGNIFVSDRDNSRIHMITRAGVVSTIAGGSAGFTDGVGANARFTYPIGICINVDGNIYVADTYNHRIRKIILE